MWRVRDNILIQLGFVCLFVLNAYTACSLSIATVRNGTLIGATMRTRLGRDIYAFLGIPYAMPPIGELRFQPPQPPIAWNGVRAATENAEICTQRNIYTYQEEIVGNEDCLYLNVYTPRMPYSEVPSFIAHRYPVMIWFHGGGWLTGAGHSKFYGSKFLLDHDLVLVTVNYRLGPLGFLSTEDLACPGNLGLKDQQQAMRWVQENIVSFSGDPNKVTLFGESAGGASVHYHMINPLSKGLFHRGISQSGNFYNPWTLTPPGSAKEKAIILGKHLRCNTDNSAELIKCLRTRDAKEIIGTDRLFQRFGYCPMIPFKPVIEPKHVGAFLTEDPLISARQGHLADIPWMTGTTSEEGSLKVPGIYGRDQGEHVKKLNSDFHNVAPLSLLYEVRYDLRDTQFRDEICTNIRKFYFGNKDIDQSDESRFKVIEMYSDAWFNHGTHEAIQDFIANQTSPIYHYHFAYRGSMSFSTIFGDPDRDYGVSHADDLQYLFPVGEQLFNNKLSKEDHKIISIMTKLWYNFANSGNPTSKITKLIPLKWKPVKTNDSPEYLYIGNSTTIIMKNNLLLERMTFWNELTHRMKFHDFKNIKDEL
ncbi:carboxylic ester hydrolase isoform X2 [Anoplolepis gracilipes]